MPFNIRNLIIFIVIGLALSSVYYFFFRQEKITSNLETTSVVNMPVGATNTNSVTQNELAQKFLSLLLNVKEIKIDNSLFSDASFGSLVDSSIVLTPDSNPGRPNPFAQFGADAVENPNFSSISAPGASTTPTASSTTPAAGI